MGVWGVTMMRDEGDIAYNVLRHMAREGLDGIIVADNLSTDETLEELKRAKTDLGHSPDYYDRRCNIVIVNDDEVGYYQSRKMTELARSAAMDFGADWIIPFDADEIWYSRDDRLADVCRNQPEGVGRLNGVLFNHFGTSLDVNDDVPFRSMVWRQRDPGALPKVAFRWDENSVIAQGNHNVTAPRGDSLGSSNVELRHFPYRSWEHFKRKAKNGAEAYNATDLPVTEGAHWRGYGQILEQHGEDALKQVYETYFWFLSPVDEGMVLDAAPFMRWKPA